MSLQEKIVGLHRRIIDPEEGGDALTVCRAVLAIPAILYGLLARLRNRAYDTGLKSVQRVNRPVISVGNITAGGTGKTPFVAWLCERLRSAAQKPAILSRGYGANERTGVDDENEMLASVIPDVPVVVNPDRVAGAKMAIEDHDADVLVMDDGFQHRRLHRDLDIVLIDALQPFGGGHMLPRGTLREPPGGLRRAEVVVITRAGQVSDAHLSELTEELRKYSDPVALATANHAPVGLEPVGQERKESLSGSCEEVRAQRWGAFCALGNPEGFRRTLEEIGVEVAFFRAFPDHHAYERKDLEQLQRRALTEDCRGLLTTQKDAVKVSSLSEHGCPLPILAVEVRMAFGRGEEELWDTISQKLGLSDGVASGLDR